MQEKQIRIAPYIGIVVLKSITGRSTVPHTAHFPGRTIGESKIRKREFTGKPCSDISNPMTLTKLKMNSMTMMQQSSLLALILIQILLPAVLHVVHRESQMLLPEPLQQP